VLLDGDGKSGEDAFYPLLGFRRVWPNPGARKTDTLTRTSDLCDCTEGMSVNMLVITMLVGQSARSCRSIVGEPGSVCFLNCDYIGHPLDVH
jgi:hypothetical protein